MQKTGPHIPVSYAARDARTIGEMFTTRCVRSGPLPAILEKRNGAWITTTWSEFYHQAAQVAQGLIDAGLKRGDRVAILGPTQASWAIYDMGSQLAGMVSFGVYPKQTVEQIGYLLDHSDAKVVFVEGEGELENVLTAVSKNALVTPSSPIGSGTTSSRNSAPSLTSKSSQRVGPSTSA